MSNYATEQDLLNAKKDVDHIATIATSTSNTATDRIGNTKLTMVGAINSITAFNPRGAWSTGTSYTLKDLYTNGGVTYVVTLAHTSTSVAADLAAGKVGVFQGLTASDAGAVNSASVNITVDSYNKLRGYLGVATVVYVAGRINSQDGAGGTFAVDMSDTTSADNGVDILVSSDGRRWKRQDSTNKIPQRAGAIADGSTDNFTAIKTTLNAMSPIGGSLNFKAGTYNITASSGEVITLNKPINLIGDGGVYTAINPQSATGTPTILVAPTASYDYTLMRLSGVALHNPSNGTRSGQNGVQLNTTLANANLAKFTMRDTIIGQGSGRGLTHLNNPANNINGGLYCGYIVNNTIKGGIDLQSSGDSNTVNNNILSGSSIGVSASLVTGASLLEIQGNNITNDGGAIRIDAGARPRILGNNIENYAVGATENGNVVVHLSGTNGVIYGGVVKENLISAFGTSTATTLLRLANCRGTLVEDNVLVSGGTANVGIAIASDCQDVRIGANSFNAAVTTKVQDAGVGTMGVIKQASLLNGWVEYSAGFSACEFIKSTDGMVHLYGTAKGGTLTNGTVIAILPVGFRPLKNLRAPALASTSVGVVSTAEITVDTSGNISVNYAQNERFVFNLTFAASGVANSVTAE